MSRPLAGKPGLLKELNRSLVLNIVRDRGPISRAMISELSNISRPTVSQIVSTLMKEDILKEVKKKTSDKTPGRRPIFLEFNSRLGYVIGIDIGISHLAGAVTDIKVKIMAETRREYSQVDEPAEERILLERLIIEVVEELTRASHIKMSEIIGIGLGISGLIDIESGNIVFSPYHSGWKGFPIRASMEKKLNIPVFADNDVKAMTLGEKWLGAAKDIDNLVYVVITDGIAAGIIIDGQLYRGVGYNAGDIGHMIVKENGPKCVCGNRGCLELVASNTALCQMGARAIAENKRTLIRELAEGNSEKVTVNVILKAAREGDKVAIALLREMGKYIAIGIGNVINTLNPGMVIFSGEVMDENSIVLETIKEILAECTLPVHQEAKVVPASFGHHAEVIGAATLVLQNFFASPELRTKSKGK